MHDIRIVTPQDAMQMLDGLQRARIIHTDMKPDNFLVAWPPTLAQAPADNPPAWSAASATAPGSRWAHGCLQLIDFGRSIDLSLLSPGVQFMGSALTEGMQCPEMLANKPWHFCVRSCPRHVCLFSGWSLCSHMRAGCLPQLPPIKAAIDAVRRRYHRRSALYCFLTQPC